ncbi:hypothetical protein FEM48_Zijuj09G0177000 [Ziziphus jujuba var. spinosa]|uniref:Uncharacterized protein n=1 Tax=Ziziphus jujuba var. spinosa TaxID=714518 RepID=A0A978UUE1_ZIZJJ|nr:hypothetical protein FEM48_Zijuj09G0177000 [Ziziphus jujuba var. spinosa]
MQDSVSRLQAQQPQRILAAAMAVVIFVSVAISRNLAILAARCFGLAVLEGSGELWDVQWVFWPGPFSACIVYYLPRKDFFRRMLNFLR